MCSKQNHDDRLRKELIKMTRIILKQNYFKFQNSFYVKKAVLAMGAPTSSILSEIYLQYVEHTAIYEVLIRNNILGYFRYVCDILIAYNDSITDIEEVLSSFNNLVPTMKFTMENGIDNAIYFLDITIQK